jgi:hypothetical protein
MNSSRLLHAFRLIFTKLVIKEEKTFYQISFSFLFLYFQGIFVVSWTSRPILSPPCSISLVTPWGKHEMLSICIHFQLNDVCRWLLLFTSFRHFQRDNSSTNSIRRLWTHTKQRALKRRCSPRYARSTIKSHLNVWTFSFISI